MYSKYSCLDLPAIKTQEDLDVLISSYAESIYEEYQETDALPDDLDDLTDALSAATSTDALQQLETALRTYLKDIQFGANGCSLVAEAYYEEDDAFSDIIEPLIKFLFSHSGSNFFLMRSAAFDTEGSFAHQWIGYWKGGEVVSEHTDEYFHRVFAQDTALVLQTA